MNALQKNRVLSLVCKVAANFRKESGCTQSEAMQWAWHYAKHEYLFVQFTKKSGEQVERLVYQSYYNKAATKGGVRTCPLDYTLHIEVQTGIADTLNDLHPLATKWLACKEQVYIPIGKAA